MNAVTIPIVPRVAMKANASGIPAKFAATPENVVRVVRRKRGVPSRMAAYAMQRPSTHPPPAVIRLILTESQYSFRYGWCQSCRMWSSVAPPCVVLKAPTMISPAGTNRNASAYAKNGSVATQASGTRLRPERESGRSAL